MKTLLNNLNCIKPQDAKVPVLWQTVYFSRQSQEEHDLHSSADDLIIRIGFNKEPPKSYYDY